MRKKQAQHLDVRYVTMVENAYYYCNPPPMEKTVRRKRPPLQEYIRKLLYKDLSKVTTEKVRHVCGGLRYGYHVRGVCVF